MTTGWRSEARIASLRLRARVSTGPPAPNGTMKVIGRDGYDWARAKPGDRKATHIATRDAFLISASFTCLLRAPREKRESLLLQVPQHVPGYGRKVGAHQDMQAQRRQRSTIECFGARHRLLQRFLRCFMPGKDAQPRTLHRATCRLRREQKAHAFVAGPRRRIERLPTWTGSDILNRHAAAGPECAAH